MCLCVVVFVYYVLCFFLRSCLDPLCGLLFVMFLLLQLSMTFVSAGCAGGLGRGGGWGKLEDLKVLLWIPSDIVCFVGVLGMCFDVAPFVLLSVLCVSVG